MSFLKTESLSSSLKRGDVIENIGTGDRRTVQTSYGAGWIVSDEEQTHSKLGNEVISLYWRRCGE